MSSVQSKQITFPSREYFKVSSSSELIPGICDLSRLQTTIVEKSLAVQLINMPSKRISLTLAVRYMDSLSGKRKPRAVFRIDRNWGALVATKLTIPYKLERHDFKILF
jgi:hypothetical protein